MATLHLKDFRGGLDVRRLQECSPSGVLWRADNVIITRGGEIQKRFAFVPTFNATGTVGLAATLHQLYVFGDGARPATLDAQVLYQNLAKAGTTLVNVESWDVFQGKIYVVAYYADGSYAHWYDGTLVQAWNNTTPVGNVNSPVLFAARRTDQVTSVLTFMRRIFVAYGNYVFFSAIDNPTVWDPTVVATPGAGFLDLSSVWGSGEVTTGLGLYQGMLAIFSRRTVQIWDVDPDPVKFQLKQMLTNIGTVARQTVENFGDQDLFFLSDTGIRSLRARDSSNNAAANDIGIPIDQIVIDLIRDNAGTITESMALIEPFSGRYWCVIGSQVFVFNFFAASKVSAWTRFDLGFTPEAAATLVNRVYLRAGNQIYLYGGPTAREYGDDYACDVEFPLLDADRPATMKMLKGLDTAQRGAWAWRVGTDPVLPNAREVVGTPVQTTYNMERIGMVGYGSHIGLRATHQAPGPAYLGSILIHFDQAETD